MECVRFTDALDCDGSQRAVHESRFTQSGAEAHALHVLAHLSNAVGEGERESVWSASGLPALWIGTAPKADIYEGWLNPERR